MPTLTLHDLAREVGMRPRTIRSYIEKDLLPGPEGAGRYAHYTSRHLERLKAIRVLREIEGLSLEETRRRLLGLGPDEIAALARHLDGWRDRPEADVLAEMATHFGSEASAEDLLSDEMPLADIAETSDERALPRPAAPSRRAMLGNRRSDPPAPEDDVPRRARAEPMTRIEITPDVELVVRGVRDERQLRRLERIADFVRHALLRRGRGR